MILLDDQDRSRWDAKAIAEGLVLLDKAMRHRRPGPYQIQAAIAALHAGAKAAADTDWIQIERLYATLERLEPSPVITLNRAVAVQKVSGAEAAPSSINSAAPTKHARLSAGRSALPARPPKPPISASSSIGWRRRNNRKPL